MAASLCTYSYLYMYAFAGIGCVFRALEEPRTVGLSGRIQRADRRGALHAAATPLRGNRGARSDGEHCARTADARAALQPAARLPRAMLGVRADGRRAARFASLDRCHVRFHDGDDWRPAARPARGPPVRRSRRRRRAHSGSAASARRRLGGRMCSGPLPQVLPDFPVCGTTDGRSV